MSALSHGLCFWAARWGQTAASEEELVQHRPSGGPESPEISYRTGGSSAKEVRALTLHSKLGWGRLSTSLNKRD